ncbi:hypothetical protein J6590_022775 [Homalodisca vitripennis]|nr:hypothetical protein J6590_022775 [Homalodisca vitripennis]
MQVFTGLHRSCQAKNYELAVFIVPLPPPSDGHPQRSLIGPAASNLRNNSPLRSDITAVQKTSYHRYKAKAINNTHHGYVWLWLCRRCRTDKQVVGVRPKALPSPCRRVKVVYKFLLLEHAPGI